MTAQTANNEGLESLVKYIRENQEPIKYTLPIAFAVAALDQFVLGNRGLDNISLDVLATYGAYCGLTKKIANPIPALVAYFTTKLGYEPLFTPKEAGLDSLWGSAVASIGTAGLARGLRYAKDNWDEKTKPAIYATGSFAKRKTPEVFKGLGAAGYATGKGIGKATLATGRGIRTATRATGNGIAYAAPIVWKYGIKKPVVATVKSPYTIPRWLWKHRPFQKKESQDQNIQPIDPTLN